MITIIWLIILIAILLAYLMRIGDIWYQLKQDDVKLSVWQAFKLLLVLTSVGIKLAINKKISGKELTNLFMAKFDVLIASFGEIVKEKKLDVKEVLSDKFERTKVGVMCYVVGNKVLMS